MPVLFNSISQFIESVGRRTVQEKPNALDTIETIFTGPSAYALSFLPAPKSRHPQYPMMYCQRSEISAKEALVCEVRVSYVGKLVGAASGVYVTNPEIHRSSHLGSISYTNSYSLYTGASFVSSSYATQTFTVRYTAAGVNFKYLTNQPETPRFTAVAIPYLGHTNLMMFQASPITYAIGRAEPLPIAGWGGFLENTLVWQNDLTSFDVNDLDNGWYEVAEAYMTQPYINSSVS